MKLNKSYLLNNENYRSGMCLVILFFLMPFAGYSQEGDLYIPPGNAMGSAKGTQLFKKVIRLVDADTKEALEGIKFLIARDGMVISPAKSDSNGCAVVTLNMRNYYKKVEINLNDDKYLGPGQKERRNKVKYVPVDGMMVRFETPKDVRDTTTVLLRRVDKPKN